MATSTPTHPKPPGMVVLHAAGDVSEARQAIIRDPGDAAATVVAIDMNPLPPATDIQECVCRSVALTASKAWPGCYEELISVTLAKGLATDIQLNAAIESAGLGGKVSAAWLRAAHSACTNGRPPLPPQHGAFETLTSLAHMLGTSPMLLVAVMDNTAAGERLDGLGRFLIRVSTKTPFRVHLVVPADIARSLELDHLNYLLHQPDLPTAGQPFAVSAMAGAADEPELSLSASTGKPHPESPGEQRLAAWLASDDMLSGLFHLNQPIRTTRHSTYRVDMVWHEGLVVIEVDGHRNHSKPHQFRLDRHRDYELALSGYLVLRLTHHEVMQDVALAGEKIRDVVRLRRSAAIHPNDSAPVTLIRESNDD